jgi:hypothetical protein
VDPVGLRLQRLELGDQIICIARLAQSRAESGNFAPADIDAIFDDVGLPRAAKTSNVLGRLEKAKLLTRVKGVRGAAWRLTPEGKSRALALMTDMDAVALNAEMATSSATVLGNTAHPTIPAHLSPPDLLGPLREFLDAHPFDNNVFGMTRFPAESDETDNEDPVAPALKVARELCSAHGLEFHLASDRQIVDDLWGNVTAHMWASRYGVAFFENRAHRGLNYNLTIEVGGMLVLGRRTALLKDKSIKSMPTDLVGKIYKSIDLDKPSSVKKALATWIKDDLAR